MADIEKLRNNPGEQLFHHLADVRAVMLGSPDPEQHMQPMAPQVDAAARRIWFFTNKSTDLVRALGSGSHDVHMCVFEKDYQACLIGALTVDHDRQIIGRYWSDTVAA